jgi:hypothetical protein
MTLPRWIAVKGNARGGVVHQAVDGHWRANNWQGCLGGFATEGEAELAILTASPKPKHKRAPKAEPPASMQWRTLTDSASGFTVRDGRGLAIGGVKPSGERFAAWFKSAPVGEFDTAGQAESAIFTANRVAKKGRRP